jgi:hypothetical protein
LVSRRLPVALIGLVAVAFLASPASALNLTAHTNRGGTCRLHTIASRTGNQIKYGVKVSDCSTRFGVRYAISQGALYDRTDGLPVSTGYLDRKKAGIPYSNQRRVGGTDPSHPYRTRIDVSIVLKTRRNRATRRPERWLDPGSRCRVKTTDHNGDTLGCELGDSLPPA